MKFFHVLLVCSLELSIFACQAQQSINASDASISVNVLNGSSAQGLSILRVEKVPFTLPTRQTGLRFVTLSIAQAIRGPVFKLTLETQPTEEFYMNYSYKTAPKGKDRYLEVFLFDGQKFELMGSSLGNTVKQMPLYLRPSNTQLGTGSYFFGVSYTLTQYKKACATIGGRYNGAYCGLK
jgi:hypothetical protein